LAQPLDEQPTWFAISLDLAGMMSLGDHTLLGHCVSLSTGENHQRCCPGAVRWKDTRVARVYVLPIFFRAFVLNSRPTVPINLVIL